MARLFLTRREIEFINDVTKEFVKDIVGQKITYWPISMLKTNVHDVYDEAIHKIFENPIKLDVLAGQPTWENRNNVFGQEQTNKLEVFVQARDLLDKGINIHEGDYFTYGDAVFEITSFLNLGNIYGQEEYATGFKLTGILARPGQFDPKTFFAPRADTSQPFEQSSVQQTFVQQRGLPENIEGATGDVRQQRDRLGEDAPQTALGEGPREVGIDETKKANVFYDE
jgi:hypothetical protein